ncbi:sensor histidine kinase KdpD [Lutibacter sp.]|uniref:sensor histidine kinase n=1 Tax=Lutibacter sp. TaxID=1925666 RepID=UPI002737669E|nr:HAMP domain-containing sensor histidine kinase [Lutibacter sp.]MDP3314027.1 HAMP domain-containing sensor histidine kinase [Lutibacter sp.]
MNKRNIYILIFIISIVGLGIIQYRYLKIGLNLAEARFNENLGQSAKKIKFDLTSQNDLTFLLGKAITNDSTYFKSNIDSVRDASSYFLKDFIASSLLENGIKTDFSYKLFARDTALFIYSSNYNSEVKKAKRYPLQLNGYLPNLVGKTLILELQFNNINGYFLYQLNSLYIPSLLFLIAIILIVIWVLRSFYWQQSNITMTNEFINNLTHELKTPVSSISLAVKILQQQDNEENNVLLEIIKSQNERLKVHIDDVLKLASLDKKNIFKLTLTDYFPHLKKLCEEFFLFSKIENIQFNYTLKDEKLLILCEPKHLSNAINNILDNAKKYNKNTPKLINLNAEIKNKKLVISVEDNGIGIAKKDQHRIFNKYFRVSSGDLYTVKGYGLGLSYVKKIIKLHKGSIEIHSSLKFGTIITFKLPQINQ